MKKVFLSIVLAAAAFTANAQLKFIPKVGISIANAAFKSGGLTITPDSKIGFQLGGALEIGVNDMFSIQPELLFIQKGFAFENSFSGTTTKSSLTLNYLEIPVLAKVQFGTDQIKFHVNAGPSLGIALSGTSKDEVGSVSQSEDVEFGSDNGQTKRTDFGLQFGGGITFSNFVLDLRYGLGLSNIVNVPSGSSDSVKNRAIGITVGYVISLGGK